jgi:protein-S-isoprenylcysteine O-methyltransferase Ste14
MTPDAHSLQVVGGNTAYRPDSPQPQSEPIGKSQVNNAPQSATVTWINLTGLAAFIIATVVLSRFGLGTAATLILCLAAPAVTIITLEKLYISSRIPFRPINPISPAPGPSGLSRPRRLYLKSVGIAVSIGSLAVIYWLFPIYRFDQTRYLVEMVQLTWVPLVLVSPLCIAFVDARQAAPEDGYFHLGLLATGDWERVDGGILRQHCLQWLVKAFFLPLMVSYAANDLVWLSKHPIENVLGPLFSQPSIDNWLNVYGFLYDYLFMIDVGMASVGYLLTLRLFDAHLRSAEPTLQGWLVCLICYPPFFRIFDHYSASNHPWGFWFEGWPTVKLVWSVLILICIGIYALATVQFGIRFSNLAHRGIITNGPYRWLKHPAYVFKILSFWLMWTPFLSMGGAMDGFRSAILMLLANLIYLARAKTEEAHLRNDPVYREYEAFMREHGLFAIARRRAQRCLAILSNAPAAGYFGKGQ